MNLLYCLFRFPASHLVIRLSLKISSFIQAVKYSSVCIFSPSPQILSSWLLTISSDGKNNRKKLKLKIKQNQIHKKKRNQSKFLISSKIVRFMFLTFQLRKVKQAQLKNLNLRSKCSSRKLFQRATKQIFKLKLKS